MNTLVGLSSPSSPSSPIGKQSKIKFSSQLSSSSDKGGGGVNKDVPWLGLKVLNLSHNELDVMPENVIENATKLEELYLDHNFLEQLPPSHSLIQLVNLKKFTAFNNDMPHMPAALLELLPTVVNMNVS